MPRRPSKPSKESRYCTSCATTPSGKRHAPATAIVLSPRRHNIDKPAPELVQLYRSKDQVERDFKEIKSVLELRPVRHRTDAKVAAHVTLCVLALAVQRKIDQLLTRANRTESAATALGELANVRLVGLQFADQDTVVAAPSQTTPARKAIAAALGVQWALQAAPLREHLRKTSR